ncbi:MAG: formylglycine-generating enzyme family protein [Sphingomonas sp.]
MRWLRRALPSIVATLVAAPCPATAASPPVPPTPPVIRDCSDCPDMLAIPMGAFSMGTRPEGYEQTEDTGESHPVAIVVPAGFLVGRTEVTVGQFARFVRASGYQPATECRSYRDGRWTLTGKAAWQRTATGEPAQDDWPVTCVTWQDAQAYAAWLAAKTGQPYRLPSEAEWEYAARGGSEAPRYWGWNSFEGVSISDSCDNANTFDVTAMRSYAFAWPHAQCADGFAYLASVAAFKPNAYGLYDAIGNAWEWTQDCYTASYANRASDSRAWVWSGGCEERVMRGGSWASRPLQARATNRGHHSERFAGTDVGFRIARDATAATARVTP